MSNTTIIGTTARVDGAESSASGVTWSAIFAGAFVAVAMSLALLVLGAGLGLSSVSPWTGAGVSAATFGVGAAIWLIIMQWVSAGFGGYLTGRLRTKWVGVHTDEIFFRDTAHGLLAWAVATIVMAMLFASTAASIISGGTQAASTVVSGAASGAGTAVAAVTDAADPTEYYVDLLFRPATNAAGTTDESAAAASAPEAPAASAQEPAATTAPAAGSADAPAPAPAQPAPQAPAAQPAQSGAAPAPGEGSEALRGETMRLLVRNLAAAEFNADDRAYLAQTIAQQTGVEPAVAEERIDAVIAQAEAAVTTAQEAADAARDVAAKFSLYFFLSLLVGAFIAITAAAIGGRQRDEVDGVLVTR